MENAVCLLESDNGTVLMATFCKRCQMLAKVFR